MVRKTNLRPVADLPNTSWMRDPTCYVRGRSFIDGTDEVAREMEAKWGIDRLRCLVGDDLRERFDGQRLKFHSAINAGELADVERESLRMRNAWTALDRAAEALGAEKPSPEVWEVALPDGTVAAIVKDRDGARNVRASGRHVRIFELFEIANLIHGFPEIVAVKVEAERLFEGGRVVAVRERQDPLREMEFSDDIPW